MRTPLKLKYDCLDCPGWCCSYTSIFVNPSDLKRLAKYFGITEAQAKKRFTKKDSVEDRQIMRHKQEKYFGTMCMFFDQDKRRCTIYHARPLGCRTYPGTKHCAYYDFLQEERNRQGDEKLIAVTTDHRMD